MAKKTTLKEIADMLFQREQASVTSWKITEGNA
jgi:hypothetical protein